MDDAVANVPRSSRVSRRELRTCDELLMEVRACTICAPYLPLGPRPVLQAHPAARILVASQAPGRKVHETGIPFNDASGDRLLQWLGMTRAQFHDRKLCAIVPMGFCYPGTGPSGDMPPRPECAPRWHEPVMSVLPRIELTVAIGHYAAAFYLGAAYDGLTEAVREQRFWPRLAVLPHPSPANNRWLARHRWFEADMVPRLRDRVAELLLPDTGRYAEVVAGEDAQMSVAIKRVYESPAKADGLRVLVDRVWPRGLTKDEVHVDHWLKDVAPSSTLRKWFGHDPKKWTEFQKRYRAELDDNPAMDQLRTLAKGHKVTLVYGAKDEEHNQAVVLADVIGGGR